MKAKTLYVGIMSREEYQKRTIAIAKVQANRFWIERQSGLTIAKTETLR